MHEGQAATAGFTPKGAILGGGASTPSAQVPTAPRVSAIPAQLVALEQEIAAAHQIAAGFDERLASVVRPEPPAQADRGHVSAGTEGVGLAERLAKANTELGYALERLYSLLNRIEL